MKGLKSLQFLGEVVYFPDVPTLTVSVLPEGRVQLKARQMVWTWGSSLG